MADKRRKIFNFPGNAKSAVWQHFGFYAVDDDAECMAVDKTNAICKTCHLAIKYSGNTTNLYSHATKKHGIEITLNGNGPKVVCESAGFQCIIPSLDLDLHELDKNRAESITKAIFWFLVADLQPITSVQRPAFRDLLHTLDQSYQLPTSNYFQHIHLPKIYEVTKEEILREVQQISNGSSMKVEIWTSSSSAKWLSISIQFIDNSWTIKSCLLRSIQVTLEPDITFALKESIAEICEYEWNTRIPVTVVGPSELFLGAGPSSLWCQIPCLAETINKAALKGFEITEVRHLIDKACTLVRGNLDRSKWLSVYDMIQWLSSNTEVIEDTLCKSSTKAQSIDIYFTSEEQILIENLLLVFKELKTATNILCEDTHPLVSMVLPILHKLLTSLSFNESDWDTISSVKKAVHETLYTAYKPDDTNLFLISATLLDPRYKGLPFISPDKQNEAKDYIFSKALDETLYDASNGDSLVARLESATGDIKTLESDIFLPKKRKIENDSDNSTLDDWFSDVVSPQSRKANTDLERVSNEFNKFQFTDRVSANSNPLQWWSKHEILFPILSRIAKTFMCSPATAVLANHVFTDASQYEKVSRSLLTDDEIEKLLFLNKNRNFYFRKTP